MKQTAMKHILKILFFITLTTGTFAKGGSGTYYIKGTAYGTDKTILKNADLTVKIGSVTKTVRTDDNGLYEIEIPWESACRSRRTLAQHKRDNKKLNAEFIYVSYVNKKVKLDNNWEKYAELFPESKEKVTRKLDLYFA